MFLIPKRCPARFAFLLEHPLRRQLLRADSLIESLRLQPGSRVLDLGAGPGVVAALIAAGLPRGELILVDPQDAMLTRARQRVVPSPGLSVAFLAASAEHVPLSDASVDVVLLVTVLGEVDDAALVIHEVHRVLRPGGMFLLVACDSAGLPFSPQPDAPAFTIYDGANSGTAGFYFRRWCPTR